MMYEQGSEAREAASLEDYIAAVRARKFVVLLMLLLAIAAAFAFLTLRVDQYEAKARVLVQPTPAGSINNSLVRPVLEQEQEVISSLRVAEQVLVDIGPGRVPEDDPVWMLERLDVSFRPDSSVLLLAVTGEDPVLMRDVANGFAADYVAQRNAAAEAVWNDETAVIQAQIDELDVAIGELDAEIEGLQRQLSQLSDEATTAERQAISTSITTINSSRNQDITSRRTLSGQLTDIEAERARTADPAEVLEFARTPTAPVGIGDGLAYAAALVVGLLLGVAAAFLLERLDRTAKDRGSIEGALGVDVLSSIPSLGMRFSRGGAGLVMRSEATSAMVEAGREAYRRLRTSLQFLRATDDVKSVIVTSSTPGEGKSTTIGNLALALAQSGERVALVSADLRRPSLENYFGVERSPGLGDWFEDPDSAEEIRTIELAPNLFLVPAGRAPSNPGELLASKTFGQLIDTLEAQVDMVLVDTPPVLNAADAAAASVHVDGVLAVVDSSRTDTTSLYRLRVDVERSGGKLIGAVLNKEKQGRLSSYRGKYAYERAAATKG